MKMLAFQLIQNVIEKKEQLENYTTGIIVLIFNNITMYDKCNYKYGGTSTIYSFITIY